MSSDGEAWFTALGKPVGEVECIEIAAYEICAHPAQEWWDAEEVERSRLETRAGLHPPDPEWLVLNETLHGAVAGAGARTRSFTSTGDSQSFDERR